MSPDEQPRGQTRALAVYLAEVGFVTAYARLMDSRVMAVVAPAPHALPAVVAKPDTAESASMSDVDSATYRATWWQVAETLM